MANKIKWLESKGEDFRGNWQQMLFSVDNSNHIFGFCAMMTYKSFKGLCRMFAQKYGCKQVEIMPDEGQCTMGVLHYFSCEQHKEVWEFRVEKAVPEGARREFTYFEESEIFNK